MLKKWFSKYSAALYDLTSGKGVKFSGSSPSGPVYLRPYYWSHIAKIKQFKPRLAERIDEFEQLFRASTHLIEINAGLGLFGWWAKTINKDIEVHAVEKNEESARLLLSNICRNAFYPFYVHPDLAHCIRFLPRESTNTPSQRSEGAAQPQTWARQLESSSFLGYKGQESSAAPMRPILVIQVDDRSVERVWGHLKANINCRIKAVIIQADYTSEREKARRLTSLTNVFDKEGYTVDHIEIPETNSYTRGMVVLARILDETRSTEPISGGTRK